MASSNLNLVGTLFIALQQKAAYADLPLAMNPKNSLGQAAFDIVKAHKVCGSKHPQGDVVEAWAALDKAYSRSGAAKQFSLSEDWNELKMEVNKHPISYLSRLSNLNSPSRGPKTNFPISFSFSVQNIQDRTERKPS